MTAPGLRDTPRPDWPPLPPGGQRGPGGWARFRAWAAVDVPARVPPPAIPALWGLAGAGHLAGADWRWGAGAGVIAAMAAGGSAWWHAAGQAEEAAARAARGATVVLDPVIGAGEAATAAGLAGGWVTAALAWGVAAPPHWWPTWALGGLSAAGYGWLNRHAAVRARRAARAQARDWAARKTEWHRLAARVEELAGTHLLELTPTLVGLVVLLDTQGTGKLASQISCRRVEERLGELYGIARGRIDAWPDVIPGRLWISVRTKNPWTRPVPHPAKDPASAAAPLLAGEPTCRDPLVIGMDPETGDALTLPVWVKGHGGQVIMIVGSPGAGKTNTISVVTERLTACTDVRVLQVNLGKARQMRALAGACPVNALGSGELGRARATLAWAVQEIEDRDFACDDPYWMPTPAAPLLVVLVDEVDQVASDPVCKEYLRLIASKGRELGVTLIFGGQRATAQWIGGADLRANVNVVLAGRFNRPEEIDKAVGRGIELPDLAGYGDGYPGVWMVVPLARPASYDRGRVLLLDDPKDLRRIACTRAHLAAWTPPAAGPPETDIQAWRWQVITGPDEVGLEAYKGPPPAGADDEQARTGAHLDPPGTVKPGITPIPGKPGKPGKTGGPGFTVDSIPDSALAIIMAAISRPGGASSGEIANLIGRSGETARKYLKLIAAAGHARSDGQGRAAKWHAAERPSLTVIGGGNGTGETGGGGTAT